MPTVCICEETKRGLKNSYGLFLSSEIRKDSHDGKLAATVINRQLRSYADSYDHASLFVSCSYDHCSGAVTIILPKYKMTILQISHGYLVFSLVTNDDKWQIYIECKLCVSTWHARVTIGPCPNPPSPTSAILYDRNCYDRNCFPTVILTTFEFYRNYISGSVLSLIRLLYQYEYRYGLCSCPMIGSPQGDSDVTSHFWIEFICLF